MDSDFLLFSCASETGQQASSKQDQDLFRLRRKVQLTILLDQTQGFHYVSFFLQKMPPLFPYAILFALFFSLYLFYAEEKNI